MIMMEVVWYTNSCYKNNLERSENGLLRQTLHIYEGKWADNSVAPLDYLVLKGLD